MHIFSRPVSSRTRSTSSKNQEKSADVNASSPSVASSDVILETKNEQEARELEELLRDNFIDDSEKLDGKSELLPRGWENVIDSEVETDIQPRDNAFLRESKESLVLFQLPKFFPANINKKIGKLRVWKSGKTEIVCQSSGEAFDIIMPDKDFSSPNLVPSDDNPVSFVKPNIVRELVSYQGNTLTSLGGIELQDMAILVPRVTHHKGSVLNFPAKTRRRNRR